MNLFKLPALKPLRAALHPLVEEQLKNYSSTNSKSCDVSKSNKRRNKKRKLEVEQLDLLKEQKRKMEAMEEEYINQAIMFKYQSYSY